MPQYDYLIVGAGLFGATFANLAKKAGKRVVVIDKRNHIAGNAYTKKEEDILVHRYGAHIFHTHDKEVWEYVNRFATFYPYRHRVVVRNGDKEYPLPFNLHTFQALWGVHSAEEAKAEIAKQTAAYLKDATNLEEYALANLGRDIYHTLVRDYTAKQWGRPCSELPAAILKRLPLRYDANDDYFADPYQGIPYEGYTAMVDKMLEGVEVHTGVDYREWMQAHPADQDKTVFTGSIDQFFDYKLGVLQYRCMRWETEMLPIRDYQGRSVVNYADPDVPYTRIVEHKYFLPQGDLPYTVISREFSHEWKEGEDAHYPIGDERNIELYNRYLALARATRPDVVFGGRLGAYRYYDMDQTIASAMRLAKDEL